MKTIARTITVLIVLLAFAPVGTHAESRDNLDQRVQHWAQSHRTSGSDKMFRVAKHFGEVKYVLPSLGAMYLYGRDKNNRQLANTASLGIRSVLIADGVTQIVKWTFHRHRPNSGIQSDTWDGPNLSKKHVSFPSGHAATAFAWATVVASNYHDTSYIAPLAYGTAALTALSRVNDNEHWLSDVLVGSAIGYYTAKILVRRHEHGDLRNIERAAMRNIPLFAVTTVF